MKRKTKDIITFSVFGTICLAFGLLSYLGFKDNTGTAMGMVGFGASVSQLIGVFKKKYREEIYK